MVLHRSRLRAELARRADDLAVRADELQDSRRRLVDAHDAERRRLERDIHDGAQQHLVALVVNLRLAQTLAARSPERSRGVLAEQVTAVDAAIGVATLPVKVASAGVDAATTSQSEADEKRGRELRKQDEERGRQARAMAERCRKGRPLPTDVCSPNAN